MGSHPAVDCLPGHSRRRRLISSGPIERRLKTPSPNTSPPPPPPTAAPAEPPAPPPSSPRASGAATSVYICPHREPSRPSKPSLSAPASTGRSSASPSRKASWCTKTIPSLEIDPRQFPRFSLNRLAANWTKTTPVSKTPSLTCSVIKWPLKTAAAVSDQQVATQQALVDQEQVDRRQRSKPDRRRTIRTGLLPHHVPSSPAASAMRLVGSGQHSPCRRRRRFGRHYPTSNPSP